MRYALVIAMLLFLCPNGYAKDAQRCGIENCHGINIVCGPHVPEACTQTYALGDFCRAYAHCEVLEGKCTLKQDPAFETCTACVRKCTDAHPNDPVGVFNCEAKCRDEITGMTKKPADAGVQQENEGRPANNAIGSENAVEENSDNPCL